MTTNPLIVKVKAYVEMANKHRSTISPTWERGLKIFMGAHATALSWTGGSAYLAINQTAAIIEMKHAVLSSAPPSPLIAPRDNNEPVEIYLTTEGKKKKDEYPELAEEPLDLEIVVPMIQQGILVDSDLVQVTDALSAEVLTKELQSEWSLEKNDAWLAASNKQKLIIGHSDNLLQWEPSLMRNTVMALNPHEVWADPAAESLSRAAWVIVRHFIDRDQAKEQYKDQLSKGSQVLADTSLVSSSSSYEQKDDFVEVIHFFQRKFKKDDRVGIRHAVIVGGVVMSDGLSKWPDIPVFRNLHYLRPFSAYGIGEPEMLADMQDLKNRLWGIMYDISNQQRGPLLLGPNSVIERMKSEWKNARRSVNTTVGVDDDMFISMQGKVISQIDAPAVSEAMRMLLQDVTNEIDRLAGVTNASRGEVLSGASGVAVERATSTAQGTVNQSARQTEMFLREMLAMSVEFILEYLPAEEMHKRNRRFPVEAIEAMKRRVKLVGYDLRVQVTAMDSDAMEFDRLAKAASTAPNLLEVPEFVIELFKRLNVNDGKKIGESIAAGIQRNLQAAQQAEAQNAAQVQ